jgi:hypothetical protein
MTTVVVEGVGGVERVLVREWYTHKGVGSDAGRPCTARPWLAALERAVNRQWPEGTRGTGVALRRDTGGPPTAMAVMKACRPLGSPHPFPSAHHPKGQADTERMLRTLKEEGLWRQAWTTPCALSNAGDAWIADAKAHDLHASLGYQPPRPFAMASPHRHSTPFVAA